MKIAKPVYAICCFPPPIVGKVRQLICASNTEVCI